MAFVSHRLLRDELWTGLDLYSTAEEWLLGTAVLLGALLAVTIPLFELVLLTHWWRRRAEFSEARRASRQDLVTLVVESLVL